MAAVNERSHSTGYIKANGACLQATSTKIAPWYVIPADDKHSAQLIIPQVIQDTFRSLHMSHMSYPTPTKKRQKELRAMRKRLAHA